MPVTPVTYYAVQCDEPDCDRATGHAGDFTAWGDAGQAVDDWENDDGVVLEDGRAYCEDHAAEHRCTDCGEAEAHDVILVREGEERVCRACLTQRAEQSA